MGLEGNIYRIAFEIPGRTRNMTYNYETTTQTILSIRGEVIFSFHIFSFFLFLSFFLWVKNKIEKNRNILHLLLFQKKLNQENLIDL